MLQVALYFNIIIIIIVLIMKCVDCCFAIGDKGCFLMYVRGRFFCDVICQTLDRSEFFQHFQATRRIWQTELHGRHPLGAGRLRGARVPLILPFTVAVRSGWKRFKTLCWLMTLGWVIYNRTYLLGLSLQIVGWRSCSVTFFTCSFKSS